MKYLRNTLILAVLAIVAVLALKFAEPLLMPLEAPPAPPAEGS